MSCIVSGKKKTLLISPPRFRDTRRAPIPRWSEGRPWHCLMRPRRLSLDLEASERAERGAPEDRGEGAEVASSVCPQPIPDGEEVASANKQKGPAGRCRPQRRVLLLLLRRRPRSRCPLALWTSVGRRPSIAHAAALAAGRGGTLHSGKERLSSGGGPRGRH